LPSDEAKTLEAQYGESRHSQHAEEWIIRDFFQDRRGGFFVDVGANHYRDKSNTYYLEMGLHWSGIAVEPIQSFEADYLAHRPRTRLRPFFVSDVSNESATLYVERGMGLASSASREFTERYAGVSDKIETITITLDDLLSAEGVEKFDFLSMDIELWEPKALAGFDIRRFSPELVCIEAHPEVRQAIIDYFHHNDYVVVAKYLRADIWNLYFTPAAPSPAPPGVGEPSR
jgi:FkbM family methyltransferase